MEEVDKIIIQSLRQIDAIVDDEINALTNFTPELVTRAVSTCLHEINMNSSLPKNLPAAIAQRFTVATTLAEACVAAGYKNNIGYQTFLYPNVIEIRRLFMFLIEQLPRITSTITDSTKQSPLKDYEILQKEIKSKILSQLKLPWVPQFCRPIANKKHTACTSLAIDFTPNINLNIPMSTNLSKDQQNYFQQLAPNIFQQTASEKYDLISSVLHKNLIDLYRDDENLENIKISSSANLSRSKFPKRPITTVIERDHSPIVEAEENHSIPLEPLTQLSLDVESLQQDCDQLNDKKEALSSKLINVKDEQPVLTKAMEGLRKQIKVNERTCLILNDPEENIKKMENIVKSTEEKRYTLEEQWKSYRKPLELQLESLQNAENTKNAITIKEMKQHILKLETELREKTAVHMQLNSELKSTQFTSAPRKEYTRRIHEFISNIRKQKNDIYKVLDDTRNLQKQINSVSGQLQRQFNYTDDLLFQSAKHDLHAKKAYKLLATLHSNCTELVELVSQTGNITKEIRDLEVQIDNERLKNIAQTLEQITNDIKTFENLYKELIAEKYSIENEITTNSFT